MHAPMFHPPWLQLGTGGQLQRYLPSAPGYAVAKRCTSSKRQSTVGQKMHYQWG